jgi:hypothetical protein
MKKAMMDIEQFDLQKRINKVIEQWFDNQMYKRHDAHDAEEIVINALDDMLDFYSGARRATEEFEERDSADWWKYM